MTQLDEANKWNGLANEIMRGITARCSGPSVSSVDASEAMASLVEVMTFIINQWSESEAELKDKIRNLAEIMEETALRRRRRIEQMKAMLMEKQ